MEEAYEYLFPFERIPCKSSILIYGFGIKGKEYYKQVKITGYCDFIGFIDRNYVKYENYSVPVYGVEDVLNLKFDYIIIALRNRKNANEAREALLKQGIQDNKIIYSCNRQNYIWEELNAHNFVEKKYEYAYEKSDLSMGCYFVGGIGDVIVSRLFVETILKYLPNISIDMYYRNAEHVLPMIYRNLPNVYYINDDSSQYMKNSPMYTLSFTLAAITPFVDRFDEKKLSLIAPQLLHTLKSITKRYEADGINKTINSRVLLERAIYNGKNYYSVLDYYGLLGITGHHVDIPYDDEGKVQYENLRLKDYFTVNYGSGMILKNEDSIAKQWPYERYVRTIDKIKKSYPNMKVVQIGAAQCRKIYNVDVCLLGKDFEIVKHILKNARFHLDIDGGMVHLATQLGTKCIVLFGPTQIAFHGYRENINISAGRCHDCLAVKGGSDTCAREMKQPECMYSITPEMVVNEINKVLA